jgi:hypothetical protein
VTDTEGLLYDLRLSMAAEAQRYRDEYWNPEPWHILFPAYMWKRVDDLKAAYVRVGFHGVQGLQGIRFANQWPTVGQVYTYDIRTGTWDR